MGWLNRSAEEEAMSRAVLRALNHSSVDTSYFDSPTKIERARASIARVRQWSESLERPIRKAYRSWLDYFDNKARENLERSVKERTVDGLIEALAPTIPKPPLD